MLVEDEDLKGVVIGVMKHYWPSQSDEWLMYIDVARGVTNVLKDDELITRLQASDLSTFGIIVDANGEFRGKMAKDKSIL